WRATSTMGSPHECKSRHRVEGGSPRGRAGRPARRGAAMTRTATTASPIETATVTDLLPRTGPVHTGAELPRLVLPAGRGWEDAVQLLTETTAIGSAESAGLRLPGLSPVQAVVRRGVDGCYRLAALASAPEVRVDGELL